MAEEATVNPDGSSSFKDGQQVPPSQEENGSNEGESPFTTDEPLKIPSKGLDPALYVLFAFIAIICLYYVFLMRKRAEESEDEFFTNLDGEKFNLKLPTEVDEYYQIKEKCIASGWEPGQNTGDQSAAGNANGPSRVIAQALMKRAIADIPIVTHIQKESAGMNKLYSQSMCSVKQWRSYQAAEAMVSAEVDEVRMEADEIEPGWSGVIWRQAMQYHQVLKQKHEMEAKAAEEQAKKRKEIEQRVMAAKSEQNDEKAKELAAEKAAQELLRAEEREKESKRAFQKGKGMKKGFLDKPKKK